MFSDARVSFLCAVLNFTDVLLLLCCSPFPTVAEAIQEELEEYRSSEVEVKKLKASMVCTENILTVNNLHFITSYVSSQK